MVIDKTSEVKLPSIDIVTLHHYSDARINERQAKSLAKYSERVRIIAIAEENVRTRQGDVDIIAVKVSKKLFQRLFVNALKVFFASRPDRAKVVYIHDALLLYLLPIFRLYGQKCFYDIHEDYPNMVKRRDELPNFLRNFFSKLVFVYQWFFSKFACGIVAAVHPLEVSIPGSHGVAIYNLPTKDIILSCADIDNPPQKRKYDMVHLGVLSNPRFDFLLEIIDKIKLKKPNFTFLFIGLRQHHCDKIEKKYGLNSGIEIIKWIPHNEVLPVLTDCRIGIGVWQVLWKHLQNAVPVKMFEYMAAGCNIVTSHMPGFENLLVKEDFEYIEIISESDTNKYAERVLFLLDNPAELLRRSVHLKKSVAENYLWDCEEKKLIEYFTKILITKPSAVQ